MPKMIQVRNVPDALHRKLKARAAEAGMSLSEYLLRDLEARANLPTERELFERIRARQARGEGVPIDRIVEVIREGRDE
jgi:plasmid stability protein